MLYWSVNSSTSSLYFVVVPINQVGAGQSADFKCKNACKLEYNANSCTM